VRPSGFVKLAKSYYNTTEEGRRSSGHFVSVFANSYRSTLSFDASFLACKSCCSRFFTFYTLNKEGFCYSEDYYILVNLMLRATRKVIDAVSKIKL
jgi:hypothetical protein